MYSGNIQNYINDIGQWYYYDAICWVQVKKAEYHKQRQCRAQSNEKFLSMMTFNLYELVYDFEFQNNETFFF